MEMIHCTRADAKSLFENKQENIPYFGRLVSNRSKNNILYKFT